MTSMPNEILQETIVNQINISLLFLLNLQLTIVRELN